MSVKATNENAKAFKSMHTPGTPLLLANVHDVTSARIVSSLPACKALATASFSVALSNGTEDSKLSLDTYLPVIRDIAVVARESGKPLTVDLQDGYGDRLEEAIRAIIDLGVVGINLEDADQVTAKMMDETVAVERVKRVLTVAAEVGVPDFVVNARSDTLLNGGSLEESIRRGEAYLKAGATSVYIISREPFSRDDITKAVTGLGGNVNIGLRLPKPSQNVSSLTSGDLAELGVARISVGPQLYFAMAEALKSAAGAVFGSTTA